MEPDRHLYKLTVLMEAINMKETIKRSDVYSSPGHLSENKKYNSVHPIVSQTLLRDSLNSTTKRMTDHSEGLL